LVAVLVKGCLVALGGGQLWGFDEVFHTCHCKIAILIAYGYGKRSWMQWWSK